MGNGTVKDLGGFVHRAVVLAVLALAVLPATGAAASGQTVVSLTFDNGLASQYGLRSILSSHGMQGSFYINSSLVGTNSYYMTWAQIRDLASDGNDIGGNSLDNVDLTSLSAAQATTEVCNDRSNLIAQGFSVSDFAYPDAKTNATVENIVQQCGYTTGRRQGGLNDPVNCVGCAYSNAIPPADPFNVKGTEWQSTALTLSQLEGWVTRAQTNGGGWVPIVFDDICDTCTAGSSVSSATLSSFLDWLSQQQNTTVKTMRQVDPPADSTPPQTTIQCNNGSCSQNFTRPVSVTLNATDSSGVSSTHYTTDGSVPTLSSPTYSAAFTVNSSATVKYRSWDTNGNVENTESQSIQIASAPAPVMISLTFDNGLASQYGIRSSLASHGMHGTFYINSGFAGSGAYYMNWSQIHDLASDGNDIGGMTVDGAKLTTLTTAQATAEVCNDRNTLISQGFSVSSFAYPYGATNATVEGIVQQCRYSTGRRQGGINDPVNCIGCAYANAIPPADQFNVKGTEWQSQPLALSDLEGWVTRAQANGGGWVPIVFDDVCDSCSAGSSVSAATFNSFLDWLSQQQNTTVKTMRQVVPPADTTPPQTTMQCNGGDCGQTFKNSVSVSLIATDSGSGVASTHYTTDGSTPTLSSPTYTGAFNLTKSTTVHYRSWDQTGNAEAVNSQYVHVTSALVVSLTFDDGIATQYQVGSWLAAHGMHATFYINSDNVGSSSYYMTWSQIHDLASAGNEIGGHTLDHVDLTSLSTSDATHQVCDDRTNLINQGFQVTSFAYPFSKSNPTVDGIVQQCGYVVARKIGGLYDASDCANCPYAENIPPANALEVHTPEWFTRPWTLQDLQGWITQAEDNGGGWVPLVFHDVCNDCANGSITASDLQAFLDWLQARGPQDVVKTMRQVVPPPKSTPPTTTITCNSAACNGWYKGSVSVALSATDPDSNVTSTHYTTDGSDPTTSSPTYTGPFTVSSTRTVKFRSWNANGDVEATKSQRIQIDTTAPTTTIACAGSACSTGYYRSPASITLNATDGGSGVSSTHYTTDGSTPSLSSPTYSGPFTITVPTTGTVTVRYRSWDMAGNVETTRSQGVKLDATAPSTKILCGGLTCSSTKSYSRTTKFTLPSTDSGSGVASIHYTTDGSTPTLSSPTYTTGFTLQSGTVTISYHAWDKVGNVETTHTQVVHVF